MAQYIDKDALVAKIKRRRSRNSRNKLNIAAAFEDNYLLSFIDSLEVKESISVDLEKELDEWMKYGPHTSYPWCTIPDAIKITAEHFFVLGFKAQKGEKV